MRVSLLSRLPVYRTSSRPPRPPHVCDAMMWNVMCTLYTHCTRRHRPIGFTPLPRPRALFVLYPLAISLFSFIAGTQRRPRPIKYVYIAANRALLCTQCMRWLVTWHDDTSNDLRVIWVYTAYIVHARYATGIIIANRLQFCCWDMNIFINFIKYFFVRILSHRMCGESEFAENKQTNGKISNKYAPN